MTDDTRELVGAERDRFVLWFDPWDADDCGYRVIRNEFVVVRYAHKCDICFGPIWPGERIRAQTEAYDGKVTTFRFCAACCEAMARRQDDDGVAIGDRYELGRRNAQKREGDRA